MCTRDRCVILGTTLAAMAVIAFKSKPLLHELMFRKWNTPIQPHCLKLGLVSGTLAGIAVGTLIFFACIRRRRTIFRFVTALCAATVISAVLGAIVAFVGIGFSSWPSEMQFGVDGDILLGYGCAAGMMGAVITTGLLAAGVPVKKT